MAASDGCCLVHIAESNCWSGAVQQVLSRQQAAGSRQQGERGREPARARAEGAPSQLGPRLEERSRIRSRPRAVRRRLGEERGAMVLFCIHPTLQHCALRRHHTAHCITPGFGFRQAGVWCMVSVDGVGLPLHCALRCRIT